MIVESSVGMRWGLPFLLFLAAQGLVSRGRFAQNAASVVMTWQINPFSLTEVRDRCLFFSSPVLVLHNLQSQQGKPPYQVFDPEEMKPPTGSKGTEAAEEPLPENMAHRAVRSLKKVGSFQTAAQISSETYTASDETSQSTIYIKTIPVGGVCNYKECL